MRKEGRTRKRGIPSWRLREIAVLARDESDHHGCSRTERLIWKKKKVRGGGVTISASDIIKKGEIRTNNLTEPFKTGKKKHVKKRHIRIIDQDRGGIRTFRVHLSIKSLKKKADRRERGWQNIRSLIGELNRIASSAQYVRGSVVLRLAIFLCNRNQRERRELRRNLSSQESDGWVFTQTDNLLLRGIKKPMG